MAPMRSRPSPDGEVASRWEGYHARTVGRGPRPLLLRACELLGPGEGRTAVDLGCGAGVDALALAHRGWVVTAVDRDPVALGVLRGQMPGNGLKIVCASFAEAVLPEAHLVHAGYSLPFCAPADFPGVWAAVLDALVPGGVFAGQFLGPHDGWAGSDGMTFHDATPPPRTVRARSAAWCRSASVTVSARSSTRHCTRPACAAPTRSARNTTHATAGCCTARPAMPACSRPRPPANGVTTTSIAGCS
jgi:tellurite methyltransferase